MSDDIAAIVAAAWERNRSKVLERVDTLSSAIAALLAGSLGAHERDEARSEAHKLAGSLGMYGFASASMLAARIENALEGADDDVDGLAEAVVALRKTLTQESPRS